MHHLHDRYGQEDVIEVLVQASMSELNDEDADGRSPMMKAAENGHYNCVHTLLKHGADVTNR